MAQAEVGALRVLLSMDAGEFSKGLDRAQKRLSRLQRSLQSTGAAMRRAGTLLSVALTVPLVAFGKRAADAARDAAELQSAFDFSFGAMAKDVNRWAEETGDALGRSTQALQEQAFTFNQLFKAATPTQEAAAALSKQFVLLANDLSSFFNVAESDALLKLRAGLVGEAEPLRAFSVFLSEAALQTKAMELGIGGANAELTEQQKILVRAAIILEQTKDAQGDLARTAESAANQQRRLSAVWQELTVLVGQKLLPALTPVIKVLSSIVEAFGKLNPQTQTAIVLTGTFAAVLGPAAIVLGSFVTALSRLGPALLLLTRGMKPLIVALTLLATVGGSVDEAIKNIEGSLSSLSGVFGDAATAVAEQAPDIAALLASPVTQMNELIKASLADSAAATTASAAELKRVMIEGQAVFEGTRTATEALALEQARLNELLKAGAIDAETYGRAMGQASAFAARNMDSLASNVSSAIGNIFRESKGAAIAQAVINTAQGITRNLAQYPQPLAGIMAAITAAAGAAQIAAIKSTSQSSGTAPSASGGGGAAAAASQAAQSVGAPQTLFVEGLERGSLFSGEAVRDLAQKLIEFQRDGGRVVLA